MSLVLLNDDGSFHKKLLVNSVLAGYKVPEGKILSWRIEIERSLPRGMFYSFFGDMLRQPNNAFFYLKTARGFIETKKVVDVHKKSREIRIFTINVFGNVAEDVEELRNHILEIFESGVQWKPQNDLNAVSPSTPTKQRRGILTKLFG